MSNAWIRGVRAIHLAVTNLEEAARFYGGIWGLLSVAADDRARYLRGTGAYHHILTLYAAPKADVVRIVFDVADRAGIDALHAAVAAANAGDLETPQALSWPGGGYGFGCKDPEGRNLAFVCEVTDHAGANPDKPDHPRKITHVNLNAGNFARTSQFYIETLGFRLADETDLFHFLRCNRDHHSIVIARAEAPTLNHIAFEMPDLDSVMRGAGRLKDNGYPIEWGVGRHGPGNNVFAYFAGPEEMPIEYTSEVEQVDESYLTRRPDYWRFPPGRSDRWGVTEPRSARLKRVQNLFRFTAAGHRLDKI